MPYSLWRRLHYLNFAVWIAATAHGLGAGTDSGSTAFLLMYAVDGGRDRNARRPPLLLGQPQAVRPVDARSWRPE